MAQAPRIKGKATDIFYKVLGKPENMDDKRTPEEKRLALILMSQEVSRVK